MLTILLSSYQLCPVPLKGKLMPLVCMMWRFLSEDFSLDIKCLTKKSDDVRKSTNLSNTSLEQDER